MWLYQGYKLIFSTQSGNIKVVIRRKKVKLTEYYNQITTRELVLVDTCVP